MHPEENRREKIGLLGISLPGERTDIALDALTRARTALAQLGFEVAGDSDLALSEREVLARVQVFAAAEVGVVVYLLGTWLEAPMVVNAIERHPGMSPVLWAIPSLPSFSLVAAGVVPVIVSEVPIHQPSTVSTVVELVPMLP